MSRPYRIPLLLLALTVALSPGCFRKERNRERGKIKLPQKVEVRKEFKEKRKAP